MQGIKIKITKGLFFFFITAITAAVMCMGYTVQAQDTEYTDAADTMTPEITVRYGQTEARSMLDMINDFRTGNEAWCWNNDNTEKVYQQNITPLTYDYNLEQIAMQRAAEIAVSFSHTRPNGQSCFDALYNDVRSYGENIAAGLSTARATFTDWQETDQKYLGQGHRRNMLNTGFQAVGIGHVYYNGIHYWVQEFGYEVSAPNSIAAANNSDTGVQLEILKSKITISVSLAGQNEYTMTCGESMNVPSVNTGMQVEEAWPKRPFIVETSVPEWKNGNPEVISVSEGRITAKKAGTAMLTATVEGNELEVRIIVNEKTSTVNRVNLKLNGVSVKGKTLKATQGKSYTLAATAVDAKGKKVSGSKITWKSSKPSIATVNGKGKVTVKKKSGKVTITASSGKKTAKVTLNVGKKKVTVTKVTITGKKSMKKGAKQTLKVSVSPVTAASSSVTWKSSKPSVATVNSKGKVTAKKKGTVKITATAKDGSKKKSTIKITVN